MASEDLLSLLFWCFLELYNWSLYALVVWKREHLVNLSFTKEGNDYRFGVTWGWWWQNFNFWMNYSFKADLLAFKASGHLFLVILTRIFFYCWINHVLCLVEGSHLLSALHLLIIFNALLHIIFHSLFNMLFLLSYLWTPKPLSLGPQLLLKSTWNQNGPYLFNAFSWCYYVWFLVHVIITSYFCIKMQLALPLIWLYSWCHKSILLFDFFLLKIRLLRIAHFSQLLV